MPDGAIRRNIKESIQKQVENYITRKIQSGEWPVESKILSERALSETLQVSRTTIRNAINTLTEQGVFVRKVGQGTFINLKPSDGICTGELLGVIGYAIHKKREQQMSISAESFYFDIFSYIEEECSKIKSKTQLFYFDDSNPNIAEMFSDFLSKVDGVIVDGEDIHNPVIYEILQNSGVPSIFHCCKPKTCFDSITSDETTAVRKLVSYLCDLGHTSIGMINGTMTYDCSHLRHNAWQKELSERNLEFQNYSVFCSSWTADEGYEAAKNLYKKYPHLSAFVCANDLLAIGVISALSELGKKVPEEISVTGFDNTEWSRHSIPPLTSVQVFTSDISRAAVYRLNERITRGVLPICHIEFQTELVIRKSCSEFKKKIGG